MNKEKILIVGAGIAGCSVALTAYWRDYDIWIADPNPEKSTSQVAAGLFNPITGRQFALTYLANEIFDFIPNFYFSAEKLLNSKLYFEGSLFRPFPDIETQIRFEKRKEDNDIKPFISEQSAPFPTWYNNLNKEGIWLAKGGWLDTPLFINSILENFKNKIIKTTFELEEAKPKNNLWHWQNHTFDKIILCKGVAESITTIGSKLPFNPVKGEILTVELPKSNNSEMAIAANNYLIPVRDNIWKIGATYSWDLSDPNPTEKGKEELLKSLTKFTNEKILILNHQAGIRPAMKGRRPVVGWLKDFPNIGILNGLGSKGISMAPYLAKCLFDNIETGYPLPIETDIARFGI